MLEFERQLKEGVVEQMRKEANIFRQLAEKDEESVKRMTRITSLMRELEEGIPDDKKDKSKFETMIATLDEQVDYLTKKSTKCRELAELVYNRAKEVEGS